MKQSDNQQESNRRWLRQRQTDQVMLVFLACYFTLQFFLVLINFKLFLILFYLFLVIIAVVVMGELVEIYKERKNKEKVS